MEKNDSKKRIFLIKTAIVVAFFIITSLTLILEVSIVSTFLLVFLLFPLNKKIPIYLAIFGLFILLVLFIMHYHSGFLIYLADHLYQDLESQRLLKVKIKELYYVNKIAVYIFYLLVINLILQAMDCRKSKE